MTLSVAFPAVPVKPVRADDDIRVVVVDDAIVVRSLLTRWIEEVPGLRLVGAFRDGQEAVDRIGDLKPDVVVLDVEMPNLDGISALPLLLKKKRDLVVIMASALTREHAEITLKALALGAADYVPKPDAERGAVVQEPVQMTQDFRSFDFLSPWEAMTTLPGDEKAERKG